MKKSKLLSLLLIPALLLTGCEEVKTDYLVIDKIITQEYDRSHSTWFKTVYENAYYLILEDYGAYRVYIEQYYKYEIGDYYTVVQYI